MRIGGFADRGWGRGLAAGGLLLLGAIYWFGAVRHLHGVNTDVTFTDQSAYLGYARNMHQTDYEFVGGRNRMPAYPFLLTLVFEDDLPMEDFFVRAKYLNIALSLLLLPAIWALLRWRLPVLEATTLTGVTAFTVFVYKAAYAQCELLFYGLNFAAFLLLLTTVCKPRWSLAAAAGVVAGLAHLTKASVLPMLAAFVFWGCLAAWARGWRRGEKSPETADGAKQVMCVALAVVLFFALLAPYLYTSKQRFDHWFYNVNSTFYIWYDSWDEAVAGTRAHGDRVHWPDLPPEEIPGPGKYFREHSAREIVDRVGLGFYRILQNLNQPFGYGKYLAIYAALCLVVAFRWRAELRRELLGKRRWLLTGFVASLVAGYVLLYSFYSPIAAGARLFLAQYLPWMFCLFAFLSLPAWRERTLVQVGGIRIRTWHAHLAVLALLASDIAFRYPHLIATRYAGN